jgi:hypothetical protein
MRGRWISVPLVALLLAACGDDDDTSADSETTTTAPAESTTTVGPGDPAVYQRIASLTDCTMLQAEFDQAEENNGRVPAGSDQAEWTLAYMEAADARMQEVGCY